MAKQPHQFVSRGLFTTLTLVARCNITIDGTLEEIRIHSDFANPNGATEFDVRLNGVTIYATPPDRPEIAMSANVVNQTGLSVAVTKGQKLEFYTTIIQTGGIGNMLVCQALINDNLGETVTSIGTLIHGATAKATPVDADELGLSDSAASWVLKRLSLTNFWANYLKAKADALYVALTGGQTIAGVKTFSSSPIVPTPTADSEASSKGYVDSLIDGRKWKTSVRAASTTALPACTYANGSSGVGATLTGNANGALAAHDGVTLAVNERVLEKDQAAGLQNGIYKVTQVGTGGTPFILTRVTDNDSSDEMVNASVTVEEGSTLETQTWVCSTNAPITMGTTAIVWVQGGGAGGITALTGDVTASGTGSVPATIPNDTITYPKMQNVSATSRILGRKSGGAGDPEECTLSEILDFISSAAQGDLLYRGAAGWARLPAGTNGHFLKTQGAGADPIWVVLAGGGDALVGNPLSQFAATTSAELAGVMTNETGTGVLVFGTGPTIASPKVSFSAGHGTDDTYDGIIIPSLNNTGGVAQWDILYLNGSSEWVLADANGTGTYPARGLAITAETTGNPVSVLVRGTVRNDAWAWTPGDPIYLSTTAGGLTQTAPSASGDKVQAVGFAITADIAFFDFNSTYITIT